MFKKSFLYAIFIVVLYSSTPVLFAQTGAFGNDNCDLITCPKIYGGNQPQITPNTNTPTQPGNQTAVIQTGTPVNTTSNVKSLIDFTANTNSNNTSFFSNFTSQKLKIDLHGIGKNCQAGNIKPIPWSLINGGVEVDTKEELLLVLDTAIKSDYRIRRITIDDNLLTISYLEPAKLFGFIPVNYLFTMVVDVNTQTIRIKDPSWLSFASTYHEQLGATLKTGLTPMMTEENLSFVSKQNLFYKHTFSTAIITYVMTPISVYPYKDTFWICVVIPFFILFLVLFGFIFGCILYFFAKRRRERYIRKIKHAHTERESIIHSPKTYVKKEVFFRSEPEKEIDSDDHETLDQYLETKRFK